MSTEKCGGRQNLHRRSSAAIGIFLGFWRSGRLDRFLRCGVEGTDIVAPDHGVGGHQREVFTMRLGDEHAVERIGVVRGESADGERVAQRDWETMRPSRKQVWDALLEVRG